MTLLAIDTSTRAMGLALYDGNQVLYESSWHSQDFHTVELAPGIQSALVQSNIEINEIKAVAVAIGPGSYTGLRIGLALAKGLAFARGMALITVPTLDILAAGQPLQDLPLAAVLKAGRSRLAVGWYENRDQRWIPKGEPVLMTVQELSAAIEKTTLICGELNEEERRLLGRKRKKAIISGPAWSVRRPAILAELAWIRWQSGEGETKIGIAPIYLQTSEAIPS